jgi:hypothetical protein
LGHIEILPSCIVVLPVPLWAALQLQAAPFSGI